MASPVPRRYFIALYSALTLLTLHWALVLYVNSSFLGQFLSNSLIGTLYVIGSSATIVAFFFIAPLLNRIGNYRLALILAILEFAVLAGMAHARTSEAALILFLIHQAVIPLILYTLDIFMEGMIGTDETGTGRKRALFLTCMSLATAFAPLAVGYLSGGRTSEFYLIYILSGCLLVPFVLILMNVFRSFADPYYETTSFTSLASFWKKTDLRNVSIVHLYLQIFFTWMVIYMPLYLREQIGFSWPEIGIIFFCGLMAYVICEYPIGILADTKVGEKELMLLGVAIVSVTTGTMAFITSESLLVWISITFATRVGASFMEATTEGYFFKHTHAKDATAISVFRIMRPLSYIIGALIGSATLVFLPMNCLFLVCGMFLIPALFFAAKLQDTK